MGAQPCLVIGLCDTRDACAISCLHLRQAPKPVRFHVLANVLTVGRPCDPMLPPCRCHHVRTRQARRKDQADHYQARRRRPQARRQALYCVGRQAHGLRRQGASHRRQVLHRQLPGRRRREKSAQQAARSGPLRKNRPRSGQTPSTEDPRQGRRRRRPGGDARRGKCNADPRRRLRGLHGGQSQPLQAHRRALPLRSQPLSRRLAVPPP